jgi:uncharacterized membrane protein
MTGMILFILLPESRIVFTGIRNRKEIEMTDQTPEPSGGKDKKTSYTGLGLAFGASFGIILGLLLFPDNFALGIPIGVAIGLAIGAGIDAQRAKDGHD